jgi:hypothetical protein
MASALRSSRTSQMENLSKGGSRSQRNPTVITYYNTILIDNSVNQGAGSHNITANRGGQAIDSVSGGTISGGSHFHASSSPTQSRGKPSENDVNTDFERIATELNCFRLRIRKLSIPDFDKDKVICFLLAAEDAANGKNYSAIMKSLAKLKPISSTILDCLPNNRDLRNIISEAIGEDS